MAQVVRIGVALTEIDQAYEERNKLVAALARLFPSGVRKTAIEGWDPAWHGCVFIDLPTGQVSWHFHDREASLFDGLPPYEKPWDGHTTPEKYERVAALQSSCSEGEPGHLWLMKPFFAAPDHVIKQGTAPLPRGRLSGICLKCPAVKI